MTVPFEQERVRDAAPPDQLMLDTAGIMSGKSSIGTGMIDYGGSQYDGSSMNMALQIYPKTA